MPGASAIGTEALNRNEFPDATVWLDPSDECKPNIAGTALHELGHVLGLDHENNRLNPERGFKLNFGPSGTPLDVYDPLSIMIHPDDPKLVPNGRKQNLVLSEQDKRLISTLYPGRWPKTVP